MVQIARWKIILILCVCGWGFLYALPNVWGHGMRSWTQEHLPSIVPHKTVNLGLDLRGGAHLLLEVKLETVIKERTEDLVSAIRPELRKAKMGYKRLKAQQDGLLVTLRNSDDRQAVKKIIRKLDRNLTLSDVGQNGIKASFSDMAMKEIKDQAISQSIEIIRRRIDETGTREPAIQRQGDNRILVQLPGLDDPSRVKELLGKDCEAYLSSC